MTSQVDPSFWAGKKILLTGHTGFKGSWLSLWLHQMGAKVTGFALPAETESHFNFTALEKVIDSRIGDIRDLETVKKVMQDVKPDIVFHMAAQALVLPSYKDPIGTYMTNIMGTAHVLEAIRANGNVRAVVNVTSDKCYENKEWSWGYRENEPMGGADPYSSSKGCAELVASAYRRSFFDTDGVTFLASARAGNVIGGGDWAQNRLVPDLVKSILKKQTLHIRHPESIRPWQHVLEPLRGYLILAEKLYKHGQPYAEGFNFGPQSSDAKEVRWIVNKLIELWGQKIEVKYDHPDVKLHEAKYLKLDCSKAENQLGWTPLWSLEDALIRIVDWTKSYQDSPATVVKTSMAQIADYMDLSHKIRLR